MITLRAMTDADEQRVRQWRNSPEVARYMYTDHSITAEEHRRWLRATLQDPRKRYWIVMHQGEDAGLACLYDIDQTHRRCSWAFYLADPDLRGKALGGFVEYAVLGHVFDELGLHKLCCEVLVSNRAVLALHEKFGFCQEGVLREHILKGGQFHDVICLAITRSQWEVRRPAMEDLLRRIAARQSRPEGAAPDD